MTFDQSRVCNRLLRALSPDDFALLEPMLERVPLTLGSVLIEAGRPITHGLFPESGAVSIVANIMVERVEVGLIGREGFVGVPVVLGTYQTPHTYIVQAAGEGMRIGSADLRAVVAERPSIFRPLGLYIQSLIVQIAQTAYVNITFNIETRLARWFLMMQDRVEGNELSFTHDFLAAMLGARRPSITEAMHVLEGTGAILATRGRIEIRNRGLLEQFAGDGYSSAEREYEHLMAEV